VQVTDDNDILHLTDNVVTAKFFGRTVAEMRHKRASEMATPPEIIRLWIAKYTESAQTGQPVSFEYRHEHEKGNRCFRATVSHLAQGLFGSRYAYSVEDVTEHKRVEDALWLHNSALSAAANAIVITDKQGTVLWANPAFAKLTGYAVAEVLGKNPRVLKSGRHDAEFYRQLWATINAGRVWSGELVNKRKDGSLYTEEMTVTPVANEQGEVINFIAIKQDITERKLIENAIRVSEVRYRSLFENMVEGAAYCQMIIEDDQPLDWVYLSVNPAFEQLTGLKNVIGKRVTEVIPGMRENDPELFALYVRVARTGQPERQGFFSVTLNMWFDLSVYSPGQGFFVAVFDVITERKRAEARVRRTNRQLTDALAELRQAQQQIIEQEKLCTLGQLASGVAHDFNNALAPIIGFSELLLKSPEKRTDAALLVKWLQHINIAATDAANVVRQLREFSQQKLAVASEQQLLDFPKLVKQVVDFTQPRWEVEAQATGRTIRVVADLVPVPLIFGEEFAIREMLTNLIFNAVDCMPTGGTITIGVAADGAAVRLWVSDTGTGMTPEVQRRCFEPFFTTKGPQGTGMGLAMVYGIVQRHSGIITVASKPEHGTTFTIRLPLTNH
ncbi:MAG: PAS domain S-box protein, partial [Verrucomicrobiota bacterium]